MASPSSPTPSVGQRRESTPFFIPDTPDASVEETFKPTGGFGTEVGGLVVLLRRNIC
jgi:hypothetical protein